MEQAANEPQVKTRIIELPLAERFGGHATGYRAEQVPHDYTFMQRGTIIAEHVPEDTAIGAKNLLNVDPKAAYKMIIKFG